MKDRNVLGTIKLYEIRYFATIDGEVKELFGYYIGNNKEESISQLEMECSECNMDLVKVISVEKKHNAA